MYNADTPPYFAIIWQPGGTVSKNVYTTWAQIQQVITAQSGAILVFIDDSLGSATVPVGTTDCENRVAFTSGSEGGASNRLILPDGAVLQDVRFITDELLVETQGTAQPNLTFTASGRIFTVLHGAQITNTGTEPVIRMGAGQILRIVFDTRGSYSSSGAPLVDMPGGGASLMLNSFTGGTFNGFNNVVTGVGGASLGIEFDAGIGAIPTNPGFAGGTTLLPIDNAQFVEYDPAVPANWPVVPNQVAQALDELAAHSSVETVFVFRPGGVAGGLIYTTWASVYAAMTAVDGPKLLQIDSSLGAAGVPAGAWDFTNVTVAGTLKGPTVLLFDDGATITNLEHVMNGIALNSQSNSPVYTITSFTALLMENRVTIQSLVGFAPFFSLVGTSVTFDGQNVVTLGNGTDAVATVDAASTLGIFLFDHSGFQANAVTGAGTLQVDFDDTVFVAPPQPVAATSLVFASQAQAEGLDNLVAANWVGPPPSTVLDAINRMAALLVTINGGPIP